MKFLALKMAFLVAAVPHPHLHTQKSPPLSSHTDPNGARFKYHAGVSLHRAVQVIRRLQHLHREQRRAERRKAAERAATSYTAQFTQPAVALAPSGGLVACIINSESGGNSQATNSTGHMGLGQWDQATWEGDGGTRFGPTPLDATAEQQRQIIRERVAVGDTAQWTKYDPC